MLSMSQENTKEDNCDKYLNEIERKRELEVGEEAARRCEEKRNLEREFRRLARARQISKDSAVTDVEALERLVERIVKEHDVLILPAKHLHLALKLKVRTGTAEKLAKKLWKNYILMARLDPKTEEHGYYEWVMEWERHRLWHEDREALWSLAKNR